MLRLDPPNTLAKKEEKKIIHPGKKNVRKYLLSGRSIKNFATIVDSISFADWSLSTSLMCF